MRHKFCLVLLSALVSLAGSRVHGSVTLNLDVENLLQADSNSVAAAGSTVVLLASTQNDSFGDLTLATNSFLVEADDVVLGIYPLGDGGVFQNAAFLDIDTTTATSSGLSLGDPLRLVWYPNLAYAPGLTGPGLGQSFGTYRTDAATLGSDIGWSVPANGTYTLAAFGISIGGDVADGELAAALSTTGQGNRPPTAVCQDLIRSADAGCQATVTAAEFNNGSTDPDDDTLQFSVNPPGPYSLGVTPVTLTVSDGKGGADTCAATITVADNTPPTIVCPGTIITQAPPASVSLIVNYPLPVTGDNCAVSNLVFTPPSGSDLPVGTNTILATVRDNAGNSNSCTFTVIIVPQSATNSAPVASCRNVTVPAGANCLAEVAVAAVDNGSFDPDADPLTLTLTPAGPYPTGTNAVTLTVADNRGGTNLCAAQIIVLDQTVPTIVCPAPLLVPAVPGEPTAVVNFSDPVTADNCGIASVICTPPSGSSFPVGTNSVTCVVTDTAGNTNGCTFAVIVTETALTVDLAVTVAALPNPVLTGSNLTYSIVVSNRSPFTATGATLTMSLPPSVNIVGVSSGCSDVGSSVICAYGTFPGNTGVAVELTVTPTIPGLLTNTVIIGANEPDGNPANNRVDQLTTVSRNPALADVDLTGSWFEGVSLASAPRQKCQGADATLRCRLRGRFNVRNFGTADAPATVVRFYLSTSATQVTGPQIGPSVSVKALKAGGSRRVKFADVFGQNLAGMFVVAVVDAGGAVIETDETNNVIAFGPLQ
ncbi:MAG: hypothetical protein PCFJNLEI_01414 [Verrucomicrobiae bacterium]|nr:hypothetical protein [Verrucomicrobiae bacterium]